VYTYLLWSVNDGTNKDAVFLATLELAICKTFVCFTAAKMEGIRDVTLGKLGGNVGCILTFLFISSLGNQLKKL